MSEPSARQQRYAKHLTESMSKRLAAGQVGAEALGELVGELGRFIIKEIDLIEVALIELELLGEMRYQEIQQRMMIQEAMLNDVRARAGA